MIWPTLLQSETLGPLDKIGIDLAPPDDQGYFETVIQCKSVKTGKLDSASNIDDAAKSILNFYGSSFTCGHFILLTNTRGLPADYRLHVNDALGWLVKQRVARSASLWDLSELEDSLKRHLESRLRRAIAGRHEELREEHRRAAGDLGPLVASVPAMIHRIEFGRDLPARLIHPDMREGFEAKGLNDYDPKSRWTILSGHFGAGKSTAVLEATRNGSRIGIVVPCRELPQIATDTKTVIESVLDTLDLFGEYDEDELPDVRRVAAEVMVHMLQEQGNPYLVAFDGLDENRFFCDPGGFTRLSNHVKWFLCPVIFTVRQELLPGVLGNFEQPLREVSDRGTSPRPGRRIDLLPWTNDQLLPLLDGILAQRDAPHLKDLREAVLNGSADTYYGDTLRNPLLFRFLIEDVVDKGLQPRRRAELFFNHIVRKIYRDLQASSRPRLGSMPTPEAYIGAMLRSLIGMARTTAEISGEGAIEVREWLSRDQAVEPLRREFPGQDLDLLLVGLTSFISLRSGSRFAAPRVFFILRAIQEFCFALSHCYQPLAGTLPANLAAMVTEIEELRRNSPESEVCRFLSDLG